MTTWSLNPTDTTKYWLSSLEIMPVCYCGDLQLVRSSPLPWEALRLLYQNVLGHHPSVLWSSASVTAFGSNWVDSRSLYTPEVIRLLLSTARTLKNKKWPSSISSHTRPCHNVVSSTNNVVCFEAWAVPFLRSALLFPSSQYKLILISSVHRISFQNLMF